MICSLCKKEIEDIAFIELSPAIVQQKIVEKEPIIFTSPQQRSYYSTVIRLHDKCFISLCGTKTSLEIKGGLGLIDVSS